jgi:hypothetical protein
MPSWANNPDYTLHATTTKPEENQHKAVFEVFEGKQSNESATRSSSDSDTKKESRKQPTTQL